MVVLIDLGDLFHRVLYNVKTLKKIAQIKSFKAGEIILLERILGILKWLGGENSSLIVCEDSFSWRKNVFSSYKEKRTSVHSFLRYKTMEILKEFGFPSEDLKKEFNRVLYDCEEFFKKRDIPVIQCPGYEADDILALCIQSLENDFFIFGADLDLLQLISPRVKALRLIKGKKPQVVDLGNIKYVISNSYFKTLEIYDWRPQHIVWIKSVLGDKSDEIPPLIPGLGPAWWLKFFKFLGDDLSIFLYDSELFYSRIYDYLKNQGKEKLLPDFETFDRRFRLVCLHKKILMEENPEGFKIFENFLNKIKEKPYMDLKRLSDGIEEMKESISFRKRVRKIT